MGHNDYTRFGKYNKFKNENKDNKKEEEVLEENTNIEYEELTNEEIEKLQEDEIIDVNLDDLVKDELPLGKVSDCEKLNVREQPSKDSKPIEILDKDDIVEIDMNSSTDDFYKVFTKSSKSGYCMKKFIKIS